MGELEAPQSALGMLRRFSVSEYHRMLERGILTEDDRVELLEGIIVEKQPHSAVRAGIIVRLNRSLVLGLGEAFDVRPQVPLTLNDHNEPEPDLAVVPTGGRPRGQHPHHAVLVIEVASASLSRDREVKACLYARASIPEYWLVDLERRCIEVYRDPDSTQGRYRSREVRSGADVIECRALPGISVPLARIFG